MASAKDIIIKPITAQAANDVVKRIHYSGKVVPNSQLHFGVFLNDKLEGAMSFGPSMDKRKTLDLVKNTGWNGFLELNRMAFSDVLPRNSESRAMAVAFRLIRKHYPHIEWIVSISEWRALGGKELPGFQLRYIYFVNPAARERLTVPVLPFSKISDMGASMYKGEKITRVKQAMTGDQPEQRRRDTDPPAPLHAETGKTFEDHQKAQP